MTCSGEFVGRLYRDSNRRLQLFRLSAFLQSNLQTCKRGCFMAAVVRPSLRLIESFGGLAVLVGRASRS